MRYLKINTSRISRCIVGPRCMYNTSVQREIIILFFRTITIIYEQMFVQDGRQDGFYTVLNCCIIYCDVILLFQHVTYMLNILLASLQKYPVGVYIYTLNITTKYHTKYYNIYCFCMLQTSAFSPYLAFNIKLNFVGIY
jgi:hypothetical protein